MNIINIKLDENMSEVLRAIVAVDLLIHQQEYDRVMHSHHYST